MMSISSAALQLHDQDVRRCFSSCTAVDASVAVWIQAECSHSKGGQGIQLHLQHVGLASSPIAISILQLQVLNLLYHQMSDCRMRPFSLLLLFPKRNSPANWTPMCSLLDTSSTSDRALLPSTTSAHASS